MQTAHTNAYQGSWLPVLGTAMGLVWSCTNFVHTARIAGKMPPIDVVPLSLMYQYYCGSCAPSKRMA